MDIPGKFSRASFSWVQYTGLATGLFLAACTATGPGSVIAPEAASSNGQLTMAPPEQALVPDWLAKEFDLMLLSSAVAAECDRFDFNRGLYERDLVVISRQSAQQGVPLENIAAYAEAVDPVTQPQRVAIAAQQRGLNTTSDPACSVADLEFEKRTRVSRYLIPAI